MLIAVVLLAVGLVLLAKAADHFVEGAAHLARVLQLSPVLIGAVVVGFGTSTPEALVSGLAALQGDPDLGVGNVLGSNIANLALVLPIAGLVGAVFVSSATLRREVPIAAAACAAFAVLVWDGLSRLDGILLLLGLAGALVLVIRTSSSRASAGGDEGDAELGAEVEEFLADTSVAREGLRTFLGLLGTIVGAQMLVSGARTVADEVGLAEGFVGLTLVAVGTSLPELVTAVVAARKGEHDLIVGNLLGSNIFNAFGVGATIGLLGPAPLADPSVAHRAILVMALVVAVSSWMMRSGKALRRWESATLLTIYAVSLPFLL